jgi:RsiW-degrading membrane proteinase PrsW (M82 family)
VSTGLIILLSAAVAAIPAGLCYFGRWLLDRARTEPPWIFPALMLMGGAGGCLFALVIAPKTTPWIAHLAPGPWGFSHWSYLLPAAFEEFGKALILIPFLATRWFRSPVDGLFYGFAAGSGFALVENFVFFVSAYEFAGGFGWVSVIMMRLLPSIVIHGGATAILGAYLGGANWARRWWTSILVPLAGFIVAVGIHAGWNALIESSAATGELGYTSIAYALLTGLTLCIIGLLSLALKLESKFFNTELKREVEAGHMSSEEVEMMGDHMARRDGKWLPRHAMRTEFIRSARSLAYSLRKSRIRGHDGDTVELQRERVQRARSGTDKPDEQGAEGDTGDSPS